MNSSIVVPPPQTARRLRPLLMLGVGILVIGSATASVDDQVTVQRFKTAIYKGKGTTFDKAAMVDKGAVLKVLERDQNKWLKVSTKIDAGDVTGFVNEVALAGGKNEGGSLLKAIPSLGERTQVTAAAAAKGVEPQTLMYANTKNIDPKVLTELRRRRDSITRADFEAFDAALKTGR